MEKERHLRMRMYGPKPADHPSVGQPCPACGIAFEAGNYTTLVPLGPGDDPEEQMKCLEGHPYTAVAVEVHWACATGEIPSSSESRKEN